MRDWNSKVKLLLNLQFIVIKVTTWAPQNYHIFVTFTTQCGCAAEQFRCIFHLWENGDFQTWNLKKVTSFCVLCRDVGSVKTGAYVTGFLHLVLVQYPPHRTQLSPSVKETAQLSFAIPRHATVSRLTANGWLKPHTFWN